ncbi:MAG: hypothetical protein HY329_01555, partial [Chloroflexi bacterium]|nr:hypothetical protein [Chloroflexota bacterium]
MKKEFIVDRQGKNYVLYAGLLDLAHEQGLKSISTTLLQVPSPENGQVAICQAIVNTEKGTFSGIGDASPDNLARAMVPHSIRMAETRAKARALRDAVNVGVTALEELGEPDENGGETAVAMELPFGESRRAPTPLRKPAQRPAADSINREDPAAATAAQIRAIYLIGRSQHGLSETEVDERC